MALATGSPLKLAQNPHVSLFPPRIKFGRASWQSAGQSPDISLTVHGGAIELEPGDIFSGRLGIREIILDRPVLEISEAFPSVASASGAKDATVSGGLFPPLDLGRLLVQGGSIVARGAGNEYRLENINFSAENMRKRQEMDIKSDFALNASGMARNGAAPAPLLAGNLAFKGKMRLYEPNLTFRNASATFTATDANLASHFSPLRLAFDGAINLDDWHLMVQRASLAFPQGSLDIKGEGNLASESFQGEGSLEGNMASLAHYLGARLDEGRENVQPLILAGHLNVNDRRLSMENLAIKIGGGSGTGKLAVALPRKEEPLKIEGHVNIGNVVLNDYSFIEKTAADATAAKTPVEKTTEPAYPELNFRVDIAGLEVKKLHVSSLGFLLNGADGAYRLDDFTFCIANGGVLASAQANFATNEMSLQANGRGVDLGYALNEIGIEGLESGRTAFEAELRATGENLDDLKHSLSGKGQMESRGLKIAALNSIAQLLQFFGGKNLDLGDSFTIIKALFYAKDGHVRFSPITASSRALSLEGGALVNLRNDYLDGSANIRALGLNLPVTFGGPFTDIKFGVSPEAIMRATKELPESFLRTMGSRNEGEKQASQPAARQSGDR